MYGGAHERAIPLHDSLATLLVSQPHGEVIAVVSGLNKVAPTAGGEDVLDLWVAANNNAK